MFMLRSFCFYFSIRLGSIIVGAFSLIQAVVFLGLGIFWYQKLHKTPAAVEDLLGDYKLLFATKFLKSIGYNPEAYSQGVIVFESIHCGVSVLLIYAAYECKEGLLVPFLLFELVRLLLSTFAHITLTMLIRENGQDLGLLIGCTLLGSFFLLYLFYMWFCVLSLRGVLRRMGLKGPPPTVESRGEGRPLPNFSTFNYGKNFYSNLAQPAF